MLRAKLGQRSSRPNSISFCSFAVIRDLLALLLLALPLIYAVKQIQPSIFLRLPGRSKYVWVVLNVLGHGGDGALPWVGFNPRSFWESVGRVGLFKPWGPFWGGRTRGLDVAGGPTRG